MKAGPDAIHGQEGCEFIGHRRAIDGLKHCPECVAVAILRAWEHLVSIVAHSEVRLCLDRRAGTLLECTVAAALRFFSHAPKCTRDRLVCVLAHSEVRVCSDRRAIVIRRTRTLCCAHTCSFSPPVLQTVVRVVALERVYNH